MTFLHTTILLPLAFTVLFPVRAADRLTLSLDGDWEIADSVEPIPPPAVFSNRVSVPGLANLATPSFPDVDRFDSRELIDTKIREGSLPASARVDTAGVPRQSRNYFWYRRTFRLPGQRQVAILRINKAQFGTAVWVNGKKAGEHLGCFSAGLFDVSGLLNWPGDNILVVRIGAHPAALPMWAPAGTDFEKYKWTPGIYDSVSIALADNPFIESVQVAPRISTSEAVIQTVLRNTGKTTVTSSLVHSVKLWKQTQVVARSPAQPLTLAPGESRTFTTSIRIPSPQLWTPETPFLYVVESATTGDSQSTRFGMREFLFDTATKRAYLNGKLYFLRGSNITLHRFFEDPECKRRPWDEQWVRKLLVDLPKRMSWNSFRFCIGPAPDQWFDIADEAGLLIQNEFFIWNGRSRFPKWSTEELLTQYREWMRDHWNHPSVAIWDACNETDAEVLRDVVIPSVRTLDLSNRPWENGYATPRGPDDPVEDHPYLFSALQRAGGSFQMTQLEGMTGAKTTNAGHPSGHAVVANEYGWLWLNRDGTPTTLTDKVYEKLLGKEATPAQRFETYAYLLAGLTEFWRAHRNFAGVLHFTSLTCSYPGVKTSDHFRDIATLELEPNFADYVREAFRPLGLYINFWQPKLAAGSKRTYAVMMVNDEPRPRAGALSLMFERGGTPSAKTQVPFSIPAYGQQTWQVTLDAPPEPGPALLKAVALPDGGEPTISRRKVEIVGN